MRNIFITGGCGYVGSVLTKYLIEKGYKITVYDTQWFGNNLETNSNLTIIKGDIRNIDDINFENYDAIVHLANIANDPSVDLNPVLSWEVNVLSSKYLIEKAIKSGVKKFCYASSGSVYGIKEEEKVTEDLDLVPISVYNKTKMIAERVFESYRDQINIFNIRPATVCGLSPRMRLDVSVNMFVHQALKNKRITLFGGEQVRPNIHILDMARVYEFFLTKDIEPGTYNAGFENYSLKNIVEKIQKEIDCEVIITESNDPRSYRQDSTKLLSRGFKQQYGVDEAIKEIKNAYLENSLPDSDICYTVKWMKQLEL